MPDSADSKITVLIADDHRLVREGMREILDLEPDLAVVGEAATGEEAVARVEELRPDIILLDVQMPGAPIAVTTERIREVSPGTGIIVVTMYEGPSLLRRLIAAGVSGYLHKDVDRQELVSAIRSVCVAPQRMVLSVSGQTMAQLHEPTPAVLSGRELAVLKLVAEALSNAQIARRLQVSEATVKRHLHSVFVKLGAVSRIDAVNKGIAGSLVSPSRTRTTAPAAGPGLAADAAAGSGGGGADAGEDLRTASLQPPLGELPEPPAQ
jgi:DNA-binding NarL/FixJ family response regulator